MMIEEKLPELAELRGMKWPKKTTFSVPELPGTYPRVNITPDNEGFGVSLSNNKIVYDRGQWVDLSNPGEKPTTTNPIVSENICLKRRVETLTRTAAISEIEVQHLREEIKEARAILAQLTQLQ